MTETNLSELEQLRSMTVIVADTGDIDEIARVKPQDATTNPSLILKAASAPKFAPMLQAARALPCGKDERIDRLLVDFGTAILAHVPGRVSTEVDARLSFDAQATVARARRLVSLYESQGVSRERVLIKIAATWEGIEAARLLESEGIHVNVTLIFSTVQALAAAKAGVTLISPFVGRIYDWHKARAGRSWVEEDHAGPNDPGVKSVREIFTLLKGIGSKTQVMGASFRNKGEILALAGCDLLTVAPKFMDAMAQSFEAVPRALDAKAVARIEEPELTQEAFVRGLMGDAMAYEKLTTGIATFVEDARTLESMLA